MLKGDGFKQWKQFVETEGAVWSIVNRAKKHQVKKCRHVRMPMNHLNPSAPSWACHNRQTLGKMWLGRNRWQSGVISTRSTSLQYVIDLIISANTFRCTRKNVVGLELCTTPWLRFKQWLHQYTVCLATRQRISGWRWMEMKQAKHLVHHHSPYKCSSFNLANVLTG